LFRIASAIWQQDDADELTERQVKKAYGYISKANQKYGAKDQQISGLYAKIHEKVEELNKREAET
jgi:hypothetical protein